MSLSEMNLTISWKDPQAVLGAHYFTAHGSVVFVDEKRKVYFKWNLLHSTFSLCWASFCVRGGLSLYGKMA